VQFKLVKLLLRSKNTDEAMDILQRLCEVDEFRERALKVLGFCFWQKGMHYLAWQKFQHLPGTDEMKDILYRLSNDMADTDQLLNAKYVLQHLCDLDPGYRDVQQRLAKVVQQIEQTSQHLERTRDLPALLVLNDSRFVIIEEINRGSMGTVYRAKDKVLDEIVALKILNEYLTTDPSAVERFKREARAAKKLSHPNIVRIHDMYEYGSKKILSMEYIVGEDLKRLLKKRVTIEPQEVIRIAQRICDALGYAHGQNIIHRDIKPANIMITEANGVKVTDFGIAKLLHATRDVTRTGSQIVGTPLYMSPEQVSGERVDARSDIYSLGVMMYEMACGRPPFIEGNIEYHHLHSEVPPPPDTVPEHLAKVIMHCLEKDAARRYQSTEELSAALAWMD
jgi:serine/threonine-protein kinase